MAVTQLTEEQAGLIDKSLPKHTSFVLNAGTGDLTVAAGVAGKRLVVLSLVIVADVIGQSFSFYSGASAGGDEVFPAMNLLAALPYTDDFQRGLFKAEVGDGLILKPGIDGAVSSLKGHISYVEV